MREEKEMKNKQENNEEEEIIYMEKVSFSDVGKAFFGSEQTEDQKDEIAQYNIEPEVKKALLEALKKVDDIVKPTTGGFARKINRLTVTSEQSKQYLKENPVKVEIDERTGEVLKKKSRKAIPVREDDNELLK